MGFFSPSPASNIIKETFSHKAPLFFLKQTFASAKKTKVYCLLLSNHIKAAATFYPIKKTLKTKVACGRELAIFNMVFIVCEKTYYNLGTTRRLLVFIFLTYFSFLFLLTYHIFYISEITTMLIFIAIYLLNINSKNEMNKNGR